MIDETVANSNRLDQRETPARAFQHKRMREASDLIRRRSSAGDIPPVDQKLRQIAKCFVELQQSRIEADYDRARPWKHADALRKVEPVQLAFENVKTVQSEPIFKDYLLSLFLYERPEKE